MKSKCSGKIWKMISILLWILAAFAMGRLLWQVWNLNMLPKQYFLILCGAALVIVALPGMLLHTKKLGKWQKQTGHGKRILGSLFAILIFAGCVAGSYVVGQVQNALESVTAPPKENIVLEIYVRTDDPAECLQDTAGYTFALPEDIPAEEIDPVLEELKTLLEGRLTTVAYPGITAQMDALFADEVDAVIMNSAYLSLLDDLEGYGDYDQRLRLIHERIVEKEVPEETKGTAFQDFLPQQDEVKDPEHTGFLVYVSGVDTRKRVSTNGRSDVNILVAVNPETHQILMVNTPRDTYLINPAGGEKALDKLTHCGLRGPGNSIQALAGIYGHTAEYYARINFAGFETLVDAIGGVTVYSDVEFGNKHYYFQKGENHLNGDEALYFARARKQLGGGDNTRGKHQMKLIEAIINKLSAETILRNYSEILESLEGMFITDMPADRIGELVQLQISEMPKWEIFSYALTGKGASDFCWALGGHAYVMYPNEESVDHASQLIEKVLIGELLTQETVNPSK